jgi:type IV secretion system protein VirB10
METQASLPGKTPPPDLTLRAAPAPVTRFNRRILTALAGVAALAVIGALLYGLGTRHGVNTPARELYSANAPVTDRLNALPSTYADVLTAKPEPPKLGAPLPGDLGRPMLAQQGLAPSRAGGEDQTTRETDQARVSNIFFGAAGAQHLIGGATSVMPATAQAISPGQTPALNLPAVDAESAQNQQDRKLAFLHQSADASVVSPQRLRPPASPYMVTAGSAIRAALLTAVNSDLPGLAEAQVTENVCDSVTGRYLLIPQGAKLIGEVDSQVSYDQERLLAAWTQLKFPDGSTMVLERLPGSDAAGAAGFDADVDYHTWRLVKGVILSSLLGISTELAANSGTQGNNRIIVATRDSANESINQVGQRIVQKDIAVQPTLTREAGYPFTVLVAKDLLLRPLGHC